MKKINSLTLNTFPKSDFPFMALQQDEVLDNTKQQCWFTLPSTVSE